MFFLRGHNIKKATLLGDKVSKQDFEEYIENEQEICVLHDGRVVLNVPFDTEEELTF